MKNGKNFFFMVPILAVLILSGCDDSSYSGSGSSGGAITVTPPAVTLTRGETQQFTSDEYYANWSLEGAVGNSNINSSGLLTVGADETASTLTVKSTDRYDSKRVGTAKVTVAAPGATPQGLMASKPGANGIVLSWTALSGASEYIVQRSANGKDFGQIGKVSGTSYTDTAVAEGASYYYRIQANGVNSQVIYTFAQDYFNLPTFAQRKLIPLAASAKHYYRFAVVSGSEYTIEWQNGNSQSTPRYFRVTAYQNNGTQIFARDGWSSNDYSNPAVFTANATGFVTILVANDTSTSQNYQIYCYGSSETSDAGTVALPPYQVTAFRVSAPSQNSITLTWDSVSDAVAYNIYRANTQNGTPGKIGESSSTSYTDNQVPSGNSFWYTIAAVNADGREGSRFQGAFGYAASHYTLTYYNSTQTLSLAASGKHYYRLAVTKDASYTIEWQNGNNQSTPRYFRVTAYQNNGTQIFARDGWSSNDYSNPAVFTANATGFVTILVANDTSASQNYQIYYY